jgi:hypothetical protein
LRESLKYPNVTLANQLWKTGEVALITDVDTEIHSLLIAASINGMPHTDKPFSITVSKGNFARIFGKQSTPVRPGGFNLSSNDPKSRISYWLVGWLDRPEVSPSTNFIKNPLTCIQFAFFD